MATVTIGAEPAPIAIDPHKTAIVMIDMQRDFLEPGGFGETLGNNVSLLSAAVGPRKALLAGARRQGMLVIHTREGHRPDLSDAPRAKVERGAPSMRIGDAGPDGPHPDPRRAGPRHHRPSCTRWRASRSSTSRARARSTRPTCGAILQQPRHRESDRRAA